MELTVGPADFGDRYVATVTWRPLRGDRYADFGVPAARTPVGTIPPDGRLACGPGGSLRGHRYVATGTWGCSGGVSRRTGCGRAEGMGKPLASSVVPEPGGFMHVPRVGV